MMFSFERSKVGIRGLCDRCKKGDLLFLGRVYRCLYCSWEVPSMLSRVPVRRGKLTLPAVKERPAVAEKAVKPVQLDLFPGQYFV